MSGSVLCASVAGLVGVGTICGWPAVLSDVVVVAVVRGERARVLEPVEPCATASGAAPARACSPARSRRTSCSPRDVRAAAPCRAVPPRLRRRTRQTGAARCPPTRALAAEVFDSRCPPQFDSAGLLAGRCEPKERSGRRWAAARLRTGNGVGSAACVTPRRRSTDAGRSARTSVRSRTAGRRSRARPRRSSTRAATSPPRRAP